MSRFSKLPIDNISNMVYDIRDTTLRIKYKVVVTNLLNNYNFFGIAVIDLAVVDLVNE